MGLSSGMWWLGGWRSIIEAMEKMTDQLLEQTVRDTVASRPDITLPGGMPKEDRRGGMGLYEASSPSSEEAKKKIMAKFTDPKAAKAALIADAKRNDPLQYRRHLATELERAKKGKTMSGAFPHKPNPKIISMISGLLKKYNWAYAKLDKQGMASDEKIRDMDPMHDKVMAGKL